MADLGIPRNTIEVLQRHHFTFQKKYGQNFLIDPNVLDRVVRAADITAEDCVLEIGPGIGTMTQRLAERAGKVAAVEIDRNLIPILEETLAPYPNVTIINEDILKLDLRQLAEEMWEGRPMKVVANLPYYITTPIVMGLLEGRPCCTASRSWYSGRWRTVCRQGRAPRTMGRFRWRCSITPGRRSWPTCRQTVSSPGPMWEAPSYG